MNEVNHANEPAPTSCDTRACAGGKCWRLPVLLAVVLAAIVAARSSQNRERGSIPPDAPKQRPAAQSGKTVSLVIDFGDGNERQFDALPWHSGMNVDDLLAEAARLPDGISYDVVGEREMTLLTRIGHAPNDNAGGRFWTYRVNGERADRSLAVYELQPGDRVLWTFGPRQ